MSKLHFTLKQHTPIIHFQHEQEGATLRATEVKPKLDKFIISNLGGIVTARQKYFDWFASSSHDSLDYKISLLPVGTAKYYAIASNPRSGKDRDRRESLRKSISAEYLYGTQYFGDNQYIADSNKHKEIRRGVLYDKITVKITSFNSTIIKEIQALFPAFIVSENFGTRQTKGFGCFTMVDMNDTKIVEYLRLNSANTGIFRIRKTGSFEEKLQYVSEHYGKLKRASPFGQPYRKAELWDYLCSKNRLKWEKRKIKLFIKDQDEQLFKRLKYDTNKNMHIIDDCDRLENEEYFYIRALLGLAEQYEFMLFNSSDKLKVTIEDNLKNDLHLKEYSIDRFKSPIRYFITNESVFLVTQKINAELQVFRDDKGISHAREFKFTINNMRGKNHFLLRIPTDFDLLDFIKKKGGFGNNLK